MCVYLLVIVCVSTCMYMYKGRLKSSQVNQDTLREYDQIRLIFQHTSPGGPHTSSISVAVLGSHWSKKLSIADMIGLVWFGYGILAIVGYLMLNPVYTYILNMICKHILSIMFLNKPGLIFFLLTVKWFQVLLSYTNNKVNHS